MIAFVPHVSVQHLVSREGSPMAGELVRDPAKELTAKIVVWGPPLLGAALLGPVGVVLGLATSVAIVVKSAVARTAMANRINNPTAIAGLYRTTHHPLRCRSP